MSDQLELRERILMLCLDHIGDGGMEKIVEAFCACFGAAAVCAAVLPAPGREALIEQAEGSLLIHANKRAEEIESGKLDSLLRRVRN